MQRLLLSCVALVLLAGSCARSSEPPPQTGPKAHHAHGELAPREKLPLAAREMLTMRMDRHGDRMILLMESVLLLNYDLARILSQELVHEPKIGRPSPDERDTIGALLPAAFFDHQDELGERASKVSAAAEARNARALTESFSRLAETCVSCHAAYLYEESEQADPAQVDGQH